MLQASRPCSSCSTAWAVSNGTCRAVASPLSRPVDLEQGKNRPGMRRKAAAQSAASVTAAPSPGLSMVQRAERAQGGPRVSEISGPAASCPSGLLHLGRCQSADWASSAHAAKPLLGEHASGFSQPLLLQLAPSSISTFPGIKTHLFHTLHLGEIPLPPP